jgi:hypothetical protein
LGKARQPVGDLGVAQYWGFRCHENNWEGTPAKSISFSFSSSSRQPDLNGAREKLAHSSQKKA